MKPVDVYEDENVEVRAILVHHPPVFPSFAYRFDTADGSIVFSGDTTVSPNLVKLAQGADVLVHEVIDRAWVESRFEPPLDPFEQAAVNHLISSHTTIEQVGEVAERAGVGTLVLDSPRPRRQPARALARGRRGLLRTTRRRRGSDAARSGSASPRRLTLALSPGVHASAPHWVSSQTI
jgi:ribonuclease BN (tRNA processing enzyme)